MEILEAYDLTGSLRAAAKLAGCDHKTVAHWVRQRELAAGTVPAAERKRPAMAPLFAGKIDELVDRSVGRIRADVAHDKLVGIGYEGSERTTRRCQCLVTPNSTRASAKIRRSPAASNFFIANSGEVWR